MAGHDVLPTRGRRGGARISTKVLGRKKRKPFVVHLPPEHSCPRMEEVPWFDERLLGENALRDSPPVGAATSTSTAAADADASSSTSTASLILPTTGISEEALVRLDAELEAFSNYVKLSSVEFEARAYVVEHVRELATQLFQRPTLNNNGAGQNKRKRRRRLDTWSDDERDNDNSKRDGDGEGGDDDDDGGSDDDDKVRVEQFGSFSAPEVCTFLSDVDMALWGVVPPTEAFLGGGTGTHTRFGDDLVADGDDDDEDSKDDEAPKLSQSALQRTMEALDAASAARSAALSSKEPPGPLQRWREALADRPSDEAVSVSNAALGSVEEQAGRGGNDAEGLFVIDREGNFDDDAQQRDVPVAAENGNDGDDNQQRAVLPNGDAKIEGKKKGSIVTNAGLDAKGEEKKDGEDFLFLVDREGARELGHEEKGDKDNERGANSQHKEAINFTRVGSSDIKSHGGGGDSRSDGKISGAVVDLTEESIEKPSAASQHDDDTASGQAKQQVESAANAAAREPLATTDAKTPAEQNDVIIINDEEDEESKEAEESNSISDDDNADKMENFNNREDESVPDGVPDGKQQYVIDLLSDDSDSDNDDNYHVRFRYSIDTEPPNVENDDDEVEVSFVRHQPKQPLLVGPTGKTKEKIVLALKKLGKKLWASQLTDTVEVRRHAKVPIIAMATRLGFDGDIAIAGQNGADTSKYATAQVRRYESFAHVVLLLKILLYQTDLDKPFTGGLGSYKLYVLVAHHVSSIFA